ncbi:MAG TPA: hypothetical protein VF408_08695 [Sediminibacterium sp.]
MGIKKTYLFIDESGDPVFYGSRRKPLVGTDGFQSYLIIGMIKTDNLIWAVQRKLLTGESRYFDALKDKYETLQNLYDEKEE